MIEVLISLGVVLSLGAAAYHLYRLKRAQVAESIHNMDDAFGLQIPPWDEGGVVLEPRADIMPDGDFEVNR